MSGLFINVRRLISEAVAVAVAAIYAAFAAAGGGALVGFIQSGVGAVLRTLQSKLRDSVNVKDFGAIGDGINDDTAAIQAAINAVKPALPGNPWDLNGTAGGTVYFPIGKFKVSATLYVPAWVNLKGAGKSATQLVASGNPGTVLSMGLPGLAPANDPLQAFHCSVSGLTIDGSELNTSGLAIYASFWMLHDVEVTHCNHNGIYIKGSYTGKAYNTYVFYCATSSGYAGVYMDGAGTGLGANDVSFIGGSIGNCYDSVRIKECNGAYFINMSIQSSLRMGFNLDASGHPVSITVRDCYFEDNCNTYAGSIFYGALTYVSIENNYFASKGAFETKCIAGESFNGVKIIGNLFNDVGVTAFIGLVNEAAGAVTFLRNLIIGNASANDSIPLFTPALKVFVDAALFDKNAPQLNRVDHLTQYALQASRLATYAATLTPQTSGTITLDASTSEVTYTKMGRHVTVQGAIAVASVAAPVGVNYVKLSLPLAIAGMNGASGQIGGAVASSQLLYAMDGDIGDSHVRIWLDCATINAGKLFRFNFSYVTT